MSISRTLGALALVITMSSCSSLGGFEPPDVTLVNLEFSDLTLFETSGVLTLRIANENDDPVTVDGGVYNVYLGGIKVGKGLSDQRVETPRLGFGTIEVPIYINNIALATRLARLLEEPQIDYQLKGKLFLDRAYGSQKVRFDRSGLLDLENLPGRDSLHQNLGGGAETLDLDAIPQ